MSNTLRNRSHDHHHKQRGLRPSVRVSKYCGSTLQYLLVTKTTEMSRITMSSKEKIAKIANQRWSLSKHSMVAS